MRPLRYSINVTLDGCCDHRVFTPDEETHLHATRSIERADAVILGRPTYELMESGWRPSRQAQPMPEWTDPFARAIDGVKKYVASSTLDHVDWNAELVPGDVVDFVRRLKQEPGDGLFVGGVRLPLALAEAGLIDEYELVVHPKVVGHGPTLFAGLSEHLDLWPVDRVELGSGVLATTYVPAGSA